jgi:phosphate acetyltransferase
MQFTDRVFTYADPAVVPDPNAEQLATIAIAGADAHRGMLGEEPRVAMLSYTTHGSASHAAVDKVPDAVKNLRDRRPDIAVDGEFQFDVAVDAAVAARKCPGSTVAGSANVFVFPNLDAGNIAYKITERLAGARAIGSFVLGLRRPWVDLSRGCSVDDIVAAAQAAARLSTQKVPA